MCGGEQVLLAVYMEMQGRDSVASIKSLYRLDSTVFKSRQKKCDFCSTIHAITALETTDSSQMFTADVRRVNAAEVRRWPPTQCSVEVKTPDSCTSLPASVLHDKLQGENFLFLSEHEKKCVRRARIKLHKAFSSVYYSIHIITVFKSIGTKWERHL